MIDPGMTYAELAERTGYSRQYLNDVVLGKRRLSVALALKLGPIIGRNARDMLIEQLDRDLEEETDGQ